MKYRISIDLNADIGEGMPYDEELLKYVSSCNIACGGHAGDDNSIMKTIKLAKARNQKVGAHPSYPDKLNFGRKSMDISVPDLIKSIDYQLSNFKEKCNKLSVDWHHIKFHGALYNDLKFDHKKASALVNLIKEKYPYTVLYVPPNSVVKSVAEEYIKICIEGFADRAYNKDLSLVSRSQLGAVLTTTENVIQQVANMVQTQKVKTISGTVQPIEVQTLCLHGDTPKALELAKAIVDYLNENNIPIQ